jgi:hypothetical protein
MSNEMIADRASQGVTYLGSSTAFFGGIAANDLAAVGGLIVGLLALLVNIYFKARHLSLVRQAVESGRGQIVIDGDGDGQ